MMTEAANDATPRVRWPGADVRRYRGRLYIAESHERQALGEDAMALGRRRRCLSLVQGWDPCESSRGAARFRLRETACRRP